MRSRVKGVSDRYGGALSQFLAEVGPVTSSVMNTAKRVIVIVACAIIFGEKMDRNAKLGAAIAVSGKIQCTSSCLLPQGGFETPRTLARGLLSS